MWAVETMNIPYSHREQFVADCEHLTDIFDASCVLFNGVKPGEGCKPAQNGELDHPLHALSKNAS
jgi:hypothetical protein